MIAGNSFGVMENIKRELKSCVPMTAKKNMKKVHDVLF